jgi:hypothetical protein
MENQNWQIRRKSAIGQQLEYCWNNEEKKWIKYEHYSSGVFSETRENARKILSNLKADDRNSKWIRLYEMI